jgi:hypothetical protein
MELSFEEIPETEQAVAPQFENNYWDNKPDHSAQKKARFSYDDILNSLNLVVQNGVLKQIQVKPTPGQGQIQSQQQPKDQKTVTFDPQLKNSYIYNKYFKDYAQPGVPMEPEVPLTPEQRKQQAIKNYLERVAAQKRIEQIKSRKLLFNTNNIHVAPNNGNLNKLFRINR